MKSERNHQDGCDGDAKHHGDINRSVPRMCLDPRVKLALTCAVRLVRGDLERLDSLHQRQCAIAIGSTLVERGESLDGDGVGLVYVRIAARDDPAQTYEGWFLDDGRFPDREASPHRGALFPTGTLTATGRCWPIELGARIPVEVPEQAAPAPMALEIAHARRFTLAELRLAPPASRLQLLHGLRPGRAPLYDVDTMEQQDALGVLYDFVDLDPGTDVANLPAHVRAHKRSGLVFLRLRSAEGTERTERLFEGWFWDKLRHPSPRSVPRDGRLFVGGSLVPTGVCLERSRVRIEPAGRLKDAARLAAAFSQITAKLRVMVAGAVR
jgi:hypothetical protein